MSEYVTIFSSYLNVLSIIWVCTKYAALGLVVIILLFLLFRKKIFIARQNFVVKIISLSYVVMIPIVVLSFSIAYGIITATNDQIIEKIPHYEQNVQYVLDHYLSDDMVIMLDADITLDKTLDAIMPAIKTSIHNQFNLAESVGDVWSEFVLSALDSPYAMSLIKSKLQSIIAEYISTDKEFVVEFFTLTPRQFINGEAITKVMVYQVSSFFSSIKTKIFLLWGVISVLILGEIIFANYCYRKRDHLSN